MSTKLFRLVFQLLSNSIRRILWLTKESKNSNSSYFNVHLLVVSNTFYARLARVCVESFLYLHPNSQIIIHCDSETEGELLRQFRVLKFFRRGKVRLDRLSNDSVWQLHKLQIILGMNGTSDIFMDCDLRWNGPIGDDARGKIVFFVEERSLSTYKGVVDALPGNIKKCSEASMKNTSYFSWSGIKILESEYDQILNCWQELYERTLDKTLSSTESISRISEQVVLSVFPELFRLPFVFLKESDQQFDGSICESSYYGASGGRFALWGNTNRKSLF